MLRTVLPLNQTSFYHINTQKLPTVAFLSQRYIIYAPLKFKGSRIYPTFLNTITRNAYIKGRFKRLSTHPLLSGKVNIYAVSYTHLDVYKRQVSTDYKNVFIFRIQ